MVRLETVSCPAETTYLRLKSVEFCELPPGQGNTDVGASEPAPLRDEEEILGFAFQGQGACRAHCARDSWVTCVWS